MVSTQHDVTALLLQLGQGNEQAANELLPIVYAELKRMARGYLHRERPGHTLQTTALVHEAYLKLVRQSVLWQGRSHFFGIAAQLMRWILVDYERNRRAAKRGAGATRLTLDPNIAQGPAHGRDVDLLALHEALDRLAKLDSQQSRIVELRFFGGLSISETAKVLSVSHATVERSWASARRARIGSR